MGTPETYLSFIQSMSSQDTGGGFVCDVLVLDDGHVLVISEEAVVLYKDEDTWENSPAEQEGVIFRSAAR